MRSIITRLTRSSKLFYREHKDVIKDIILFGSVVRGKPEPKDVDVLLIFVDKIDKDIEYEYKKKVDIDNISVISKDQKGIYEDTFTAREAVLFEGFSIIDGRFMSDKFGFSSLGLFIYETRRMTNVEKTRFYYALNGRRGSEGIIKSLKGIKLSDNIMAFHLQDVEKAKEFFDHWKIEYKYVPTLIPLRLSKEHIIGKVI